MLAAHATLRPMLAIRTLQQCSRSSCPAALWIARRWGIPAALYSDIAADGLVLTRPPVHGRRPLELLVNEAYRSLRFYNATVTVTVIAALGDLQAPPRSPHALVKALIRSLTHFRGDEVAPLLAGLSKLGISHRMLTAHLLKVHLRHLRSRLASAAGPCERGGGCTPTRPAQARAPDTEPDNCRAADAVEQTVQLLAAMTATVQRHHTQRTTRAFLRCVDAALAPLLARCLRDRTLEEWAETSRTPSRGAPTPEGEAPVNGLSTAQLHACSRPRSGAALLHKVLYLFEVHRNAALIDVGPTPVPRVMAQLLRLVCPHLDLATTLHILGCVWASDEAEGAASLNGEPREYVEGLCAALRRHALALDRAATSASGASPALGELDWRARDVLARCRRWAEAETATGVVRPASSATEESPLTSAEGRGRTCRGMPDQGPAAVSPQAFLHEVSRGRVMCSTLRDAVAQGGRHETSTRYPSWSTVLGEALRSVLPVESSGTNTACEDLSTGPSCPVEFSYLLFLQSPAVAELASEPSGSQPSPTRSRRAQRFRASPPCPRRDGLVHILHGLTLLLHQAYEVATGVGCASSASHRRDLTLLMSRSTALLRLISPAANVVDGGRRSARVKPRGPVARSVPADEVASTVHPPFLQSELDLCLSCLALLTPTREGDGAAPALWIGREVCRGPPVSRRPPSQVHEGWQRAVEQFVAAAVEQWRWVVRRERAALCAEVARRLPVRGRGRLWLFHSVPGLARAERELLVAQQRTFALASWRSTAQLVRLHCARAAGPGEEPPMELGVDALCELVHDLSATLAATMGVWSETGSRGGPGFVQLLAAMVELWQAARLVTDPRERAQILGALLRSPALPEVLRVCLSIAERAGPLRFSGTNDPAAVGHAPTRDVLVPALHGGPCVVRDGEYGSSGCPDPLEGLALPLLECVYDSGTEETWPGAQEAQHCSALLLLSVVRWHPLARRSASALGEWQALASLSQIASDDEEEVGVAADVPAAGSAPFRFRAPMSSTRWTGSCSYTAGGGPTLGAGPPERIGWQSVFSPPPAPHAAASCTPSCTVGSWTPGSGPAGGRARWGGRRGRLRSAWEPQATFDESVTEVLAYGVLRAGQWSRAQFEHTLREPGPPTSLLEYQWQRVGGGLWPSRPSLPGSLGEEAGRLEQRGGGATGGGRAPPQAAQRARCGDDGESLTSAGAAAGDTLTVLPRWLQEFLLDAKRSVSRADTCELLRLEALLSKLPLAPLPTAAEGEAGRVECHTRAVGGTSGHVQGALCGCPLTRARLLCSATINLTVLSFGAQAADSPSTIPAGDAVDSCWGVDCRPCKGAGYQTRLRELTSRLTSQLADLLRAVEPAIAAGAGGHAKHTAMPAAGGLCSAETAELAGTLSAAMEGALPFAIVDALGTPVGSDCDERLQATCELCLVWLTHLFPLDTERMAQLRLGQQHVQDRTVSAVVDDSRAAHCGAPLATSATRWDEKPVLPTPLAWGCKSGRLYAILTSVCRLGCEDGGAGAPTVSALEEDLFLFHLVLLHRTVRTVMEELVGRPAVQTSAPLVAGATPADATAQRGVARLMLHLTLLHVLHAFWPLESLPSATVGDERATLQGAMCSDSPHSVLALLREDLRVVGELAYRYLSPGHACRVSTIAYTVLRALPSDSGGAGPV